MSLPESIRGIPELGPSGWAELLRIGRKADTAAASSVAHARVANEDVVAQNFIIHAIGMAD